MTFNPVHKTLLGQLGFADTNNDGLATFEEQNHYIRSAQKGAFEALAGLGGNLAAVDAVDLAALRDFKKLALVLKNDPEYKTDIINRGVLTYRKKEVAPDQARNRDGIPPVPYKRLVTYLQMGLRIYDAKGEYDKQTKDAVWSFQKKVGLALERNGTFVDRSTLGALILHLENRPEDLISEIETLRNRCTGGRYLDHDPELARVVVRALQYLYPNRIEPFASLDQKPALRDMANTVLEEEFGGTLVGPKILARIIEKLRGPTPAVVPSNMPAKWPTPGSLPDPRTVG